MPRLDQSLIYKARKISPYLPLILQATRTLPSAINELRWLKEYVEDSNPRLCRLKTKRKLLELVKKRARGVPLQYILGSQPFGKLDIKCRPGVLIPRYVFTFSQTRFIAQLVKHIDLRLKHTHFIWPNSSKKIIFILQ